MHKILEQFNTGLPFPDVFPEDFHNCLPNREYFTFRNLDHFRHVVSKLKQKSDDYCGMSYEEALRKLLAGESDFPKEEQELIRDKVRQKLHKRGLISEDVYEAYRYTVDGTNLGVDPGKFAAGESDCVISPAREYVDFFYELYVSISYQWSISNEDIRKNCAKLCATIEELERQHIFIKVACVLPIRDSGKGGRHFFSDVPLFSHKDPKSAETMSSVINDRLLRKFFFAILENFYEDQISYGYGYPVDMDSALNIGRDFDPVKFFQSVVEAVGA